MMSREHAKEVLDFLDSIEGAGYGGMAAFEIARQYAREAVAEPQKPSRRDDWHYDSQGYCDNPGRGY